jgi:hypothetical protein
MRKTPLIPVICGAMFSVVVVIPAHAQATRTWVSGVGDDANPCSRTAPCKTFAGAISKTAAGGIINCIDPGGFGAVTITRSITIDCTATFAGILASGTNGINVSAAATDVVTLRGLSIEGAPGTGLIGINATTGTILHVENCKIFAFRGGAAIGINYAPPAGVTGRLFMSNTVVADNGSSGSNGGIVIKPVGSGSARVVLDRVQLTNNSNGLRADGSGNTGGVSVTFRDSIAAGNAVNGITSTSPSAGSVTVVFVDRSSLFNNGSAGFQSDGPNGNGILSNTVVTRNSTGLSITNSGSLFSYRNNNVDGNFITNGAPNNFFTLN